MIKLDGMLMIGSAVANSGKTELACGLIRKVATSKPIIGLKVTTINAKDGQCPRGGQGCGVCSGLEGNFAITEETDSNSGKDTARLLAAGASRVFWLRVMKAYLKEGLTALLDMIRPDAVLVCESNSLRQVVQPGLFLIVKSRGSKVWKSSARNVRTYADRIVAAETKGFDIDLDRIKVTDGKWTMQERATAIIMSGGDSRRMGTDKSMLPIKTGGRQFCNRSQDESVRPMVEYVCDQLRGSFEQILISANDVEKYDFLGFEIIRDKIPGQGPLMGIASVLEVSANDLNFVVACDIPQIEMAHVRKMLAEAEGFDAVIPTSGAGRYEPLFAVYRRSAFEVINEVLSSGGRKISDVFAGCRVKYIKLSVSQRLTNLNTTAEYEEFQKRYGD